jgi:hypothetical protein
MGHSLLPFSLVFPLVAVGQLQDILQLAGGKPL